VVRWVDPQELPWDRSSMATSDLARLPRSFMKLMAGFSHERAGLYHLKRAIAEPPQSLQRHIWPWLDEAAQMYALGYASGQGSDLDQSGDQFVKLLLELRVVLLQDSALLMPRFPKLPLWKHPVFSHDDWSRFAEQVREAEAREEEPEHVLLARTQPLVASEIAALNRNPSGLIQHGTTVVSDHRCREGSEELPRRSDQRPNSADRPEPGASETAPGPEAVKESFLIESFGDILSTTALTSRSPPARRLASDAPPATVAPGPSLESNTQARPVAEGCPIDPINETTVVISARLLIHGVIIFLGAKLKPAGYVSYIESPTSAR